MTKKFWNTTRRLKGRPRLVGNCLVYVYQLYNSNSNFKTTSNLQISFFHKFHLSFEENYLSLNIPKNHQKHF